MTTNSLTTQRLDEIATLAQSRGCSIEWAIFILRNHLKHGDEPINKVEIARKAIFNVTGQHVG